jgi:hypothetical protein
VTLVRILPAAAFYTSARSQGFGQSAHVNKPRPCIRGECRSIVPCDYGSYEIVEELLTIPAIFLSADRAQSRASVSLSTIIILLTANASTTLAETGIAGGIAGP